jgi:hypothetical protein
MSIIQIYIWIIRWVCKSYTALIIIHLYLHHSTFFDFTAVNHTLAAAVRWTARILKFPGFWDIPPGDLPNRINADFSHHSNQMLQGLHTVFFSIDLGKSVLLKYRTTGRSSAEYYMLFACTTWSTWSAWKKYHRLRTQLSNKSQYFGWVMGENRFLELSWNQVWNRVANVP